MRKFKHIKTGLIATPLEYFINYFTPKLNKHQIKNFKKLIEAGEQGKYLFIIKNRRRLWKHGCGLVCTIYKH